MKLDQSVFYRTRITPWHDSDPACWILIFFAGVVFLFALTGIDTATSRPEFRNCLWVPITLAGISILILINVLVRMGTRNRSA